jgi:hypothetical protein
MKPLAWIVLVVALMTLEAAGERAAAQYANPSPAPANAPSETMPGSGGPKTDGSAVQHGAQPNAQEVRPGTRDGDQPSASAGEVVRDPSPTRILGLPVTAALLIAAVIVALLVVAGVVIPSARRRAQARGGGTYGR